MLWPNGLMQILTAGLRWLQHESGRDGILVSSEQRTHYERLQQQALKSGCLVGVLSWDGADVNPGIFLGWRVPEWHDQLIEHSDLDRWDFDSWSDEDPSEILDREIQAVWDAEFDLEALVLIGGQKSLASVENVIYPMPMEPQPNDWPNPKAR